MGLTAIRFVPFASSAGPAAGTRPRLNLQKWFDLPVVRYSFDHAIHNHATMLDNRFKAM